MKPNYICANGHTFDEPLIGEKLDHSHFHRIMACPVCHTRDFKEYPSLDELRSLESKTKTRVTKPGWAIQGSTMVHFKCELCSCEFESPISECSMLFIMQYIHSVPIHGVPTARHKCPNEFCGVECEEAIEDLNIFGGQHE